MPDNEHYRIVEECDKSRLELIHLKKSDAGQMRCVANTPAGSATSTSDIKFGNPIFFL